MVKRHPSYLSMEYALSQQGILSQRACTLTLITTKIPRIYKTKDIILEYHQISRTLFWGYKKQGIVLNMPPINKQKGFDCLTSSIIASEILNKEGIASQVFVGPDEQGMWKNHAYLKVENNIVDFTPNYPPIGANHPQGTLLTQEEINGYKFPYELPIIGGSVPLKHFNDSTLNLGFDKYNKSLVKLRKDNLPAFNIFLLKLSSKNGKWNLEKIDAHLATNVVGKTIRQLYPKIEEFIPTQ